jgi:hypothetical protein
VVLRLGPCKVLRLVVEVDQNHHAIGTVLDTGVTNGVEKLFILLFKGDIKSDLCIVLVFYPYSLEGVCAPARR